MDQEYVCRQTLFKSTRSWNGKHGTDTNSMHKHQIFDIDFEMDTGYFHILLYQKFDLAFKKTEKEMTFILHKEFVRN